jgi:hypothetical protein
MSHATLSEILEWSQDRPGWQRDALRRLFVAGALTPDDVADLVDICKAAHGLSDPRTPNVLTSKHLAITEAGTADRWTKATALANVVVPALALIAFYVTLRQLGDQRMQLGSGSLQLRVRILVEQDEPRKVRRAEERTERGGEALFGGFQVDDARVS